MTDLQALIGNRIQNMGELQQRIAEIEAMEVVQELQNVKKMLKKLDGEVRQFALDGYQDNGAQHPHGAVSIQMRQTFEYDDTVAFDYLREEITPHNNAKRLMVDPSMMHYVIDTLAETQPDCLLVNHKEFTKSLKAHDDLPGFVTEIKEPFVKVASDLSEFVK